MNYSYLINLPVKTNFVLVGFIVQIILIFLLILFFPVYRVYSTYFYVDQTLIYIKLPINYPDIIEKMEYGIINEQKYSLPIKNVSPVMVNKETMESYQLVALESPKTFFNDEIIKIDIYYDKQKVWQKLKQWLF